MIEITGTVIRGLQYEHKAPTANLELEFELPPGIFTALIQHNGSVIGQGMIWSTPGKNVVEVYIGQFDGDLYGEQLTLLQLHRLERPLLCKLMDQALKSVPLEQHGPASSAPTPEPHVNQAHSLTG
tara:strand:- start:14 stop:391 length:378 start_codon:yes stop_codon:yes gene_type:complete